MSISSIQSQPEPNWIDDRTPQPGSKKISSKTKEKSDSDRSDKKKTEKEDATELDRKEKQQIQKLRQRDREVRQHETAHKTAGGPYVKGISYTYQEGPDGRQYAIGGTATMDTSPVAGKPEKTIKKAKMVKEAALAPAQPSSKDLKIASRAVQMKRKAKAKLENSQQPRKNQKQKLINNYQTNLKPDSTAQHFSLIA